jgi:hypothetical protein
MDNNPVILIHRRRIRCASIVAGFSEFAHCSSQPLKAMGRAATIPTVANAQ